MVVEFLGYIGLLLLIVSLSQNNLELMRKWGIASCSFLLVQAFLLNVISLLVINCVVIAIHSYKLFKVKK